MRPADHLYSELESLKSRSNSPMFRFADEAKHLFSRTIKPFVGDVVTEELFAWWLTRHDGKRDPIALGHIASFILEGYDETQDLDLDDWRSIKDVFSAEAETIDLQILSRVMADLVERGALDN